MFAQVAEVTESTLKNNQLPAGIAVVQLVNVEDDAFVAVVTVGLAEAVIVCPEVGG